MTIFALNKLKTTKMKKAFLAFGKLARLAGAAVMIAFVSVSVTSCSTEGCTDDTATNYDEKADEDDGSCTYERDAIIGTYNNSTDNCISGNSFNMTISAGAAATNQISISNFGGFGSSISVNAVVSGSSITLQSGSLGSGLSLLSGTGAISGSLLTINYTYDEGGDEYTCTITGTRTN
jgi:hypothetical protein